MFSKPFLIERAFNKDSKYVLPKCAARGGLELQKNKSVHIQFDIPNLRAKRLGGVLWSAVLKLTL